MPVESRDDLVKRLCDDIRQLTKMVEQASFSAETGVRVKDPSLLLADLENAATRIASDAKRIAAIERELDTANANHRDMASRLNDMGTQLEQARSALAEERERCARAVYGAVAMVPMGQVDASEFLDSIEDEIATAIRAGKPEKGE